MAKKAPAKKAPAKKASAKKAPAKPKARAAPAPADKAVVENDDGDDESPLPPSQASQASLTAGGGDKEGMTVAATVAKGTPKKRGKKEMPSTASLEFGKLKSSPVIMCQIADTKLTLTGDAGVLGKFKAERPDPERASSEYPEHALVQLDLKGKLTRASTPSSTTLFHLS
ncbi:uncharacterized protein AMSG_00278 [Thecamonas trahens ATCC 50062]|uniref:Uncharacterized protein n=1 Tax=Thecamonas trahens ATCC 50062 TaxID=461836 RepID=A0A0L0D1C7_THETB|nr:hypothetical protein AMSG_00278 [Thecamonas trahens ATCC 50062]KNC46159.1 hypothetical protein AMSG_00278 [Thecamonas trahens ATCC 50062]|eukprot:XP_013763135.1 hypothetical protein AMSG_00278 [Thecamonas trahens ATCC 50062]